MAKNLKQVLDDAKTYPDTLEFAVGDDKVTLGELRAARADMEAEVAKKSKVVDDKFREVTDLATKAAELKATYERQVADLEKNNHGRERGATSDDEFESDPFWQPASKKFKAINDTVQKMNETVTKLAGAMEKATTIWAEDRWRSQFDRLQPRLQKIEKHKNMTYEQVRDYAAEHKLLDRHGLPSVERAILDLTAESEKEAAMQEAFERGRREGEMRGRLAATGRPTSASGPKKPDKSHVAEKGLEGLGDDVAEDKELTQMLADLGASNPADFGAA